MVVYVTDYFVTLLVDVLPNMKVNFLKLLRGKTMRPAGVVEPEQTHCQVAYDSVMMNSCRKRRAS